MQVNARLVLASCLTVMAAGAAGGCSVFERDLDDGGLPAWTAQPDAPTLPAKAVSTDDDRDPGEAVDAATSGGGDDELVKTLSLTTKDVSKRRLRVKVDTDTVDEPTLFGCAGAYPSEDHRVARRRVAVTGGDIPAAGSSDIVLTSDVVAYDSEKAATGALQEWRARLEECPSDAGIDMLGVRALTRDKLELVATCDLPGDVAECVRVNVMFDNESGEKTYCYAVVQRAGKVLALTSRQSRTAPARTNKAAVLDLAEETSRRLADQA